MKKTILFLTALVLAAGVTLAQRPFYRSYTMGTNGLLSVTNNFTPGAAQDQLLVQVPDYVLFKFPAALPVSTVTVTRTSATASFGVGAPLQVATGASQAQITFTNNFSYRNADVFAIQMLPTPTSSVSIEVGYK